MKINSNKAGVIKTATDACGVNVVDLCEYMAAEAKTRSPRDTGNNANSIAFKVERRQGGITGRVFTESGYGGWLEIGTSRMPARPYLAPAYQHARNKMK